MKITRAFIPVLIGFALFGGQSARFEEAKRAGIGYTQSEQYDKAAGRLEEVWEQDKSDSTAGEYLALAYLNSEDLANRPANRAKGFAIIHQLASQGSRVTFAVMHSHESMGWLQGRQWNRYCRGRLSITPGRLVFISEKGEKAGEHSFDLDREKLKSISSSRKEDRGSFQLKTDQISYLMAARSASPAETNLIADLIRQQVMPK